MERFGSQADLARLLGVSRQAISKAAHAGRLVIAADGRIDLPESCELILATTADVLTLAKMVEALDRRREPAARD